MWWKRRFLDKDSSQKRLLKCLDNIKYKKIDKAKNIGRQIKPILANEKRAKANSAWRPQAELSR